MPHEPTWKYVEKTGIDKPHKEIIGVYDAEYGKYKEDESAHRTSSKPSHDTKSPLKGLTGGK